MNQNTKNLAVQLKMEAMRTENRVAEIRGEYPSWGYNDFMRLAAELTVTQNPKPKNRKGYVVVDTGSVDSFLESAGYYLMGRRVNMLAVNFYGEYVDYCSIYKLTPLSNVKFSYKIADLGYLKERKVDGITYTIYTK